MKSLSIERELPDVDLSVITPELGRAEALQAWALYQAGVVRELYFRADKLEAVLILECAGVEETAAALATLPLVQAGLIAFALIPLKAYPGFARLFGYPPLRTPTVREGPQPPYRRSARRRSSSVHKSP